MARPAIPAPTVAILLFLGEGPDAWPPCVSVFYLMAATPSNQALSESKSLRRGMFVSATDLFFAVQLSRTGSLSPRPLGADVSDSMPWM